MFPGSYVLNTQAQNEPHGRECLCMDYDVFHQEAPAARFASTAGTPIVLRLCTQDPILI